MESNEREKKEAMKKHRSQKQEIKHEEKENLFERTAQCFYNVSLAVEERKLRGLG